MDSTIYIACVSSDEYAPYMATTLISVFENASKDKDYCVFVLTENMSDRSRKKISALEKKYNVRIEYKYLDDDCFKLMEGMKYGEHVGRLASGRLVLADIYPDIDKIISIEADMFFKDDISKLWNIPLDGYCTSAVEDLMQKIISKNLFGDEKHIYFNTGVQVMNLAQMRKDNYKQLLKKAVETKGKLFSIPEQDIVNVAYENKILPLDIKWNFYHVYYPETMKRRAQFEPLDKNAFDNALVSPSVVHTPGPDKLWYPAVYHPYKAEYMQYFVKNPFYNPFKLFYLDKYRMRYEKHWGIRVKNFDILSKRSFLENVKIKFFGLTIFDKKNESDNKTVKILFGLFKREKSKTKEKISFLGISLKKKKQNGDKKDIRLLYGLFRLKETPNRKRIYVLFIPIYSKNDKADSLKNMNQKLEHVFKQNVFLIHKVSALKSIIDASLLHKDVFQEYKNAFSGKEAVLICTGPTANKYDMIPKAIHIGVNGACYLNHIKLDFLFAQDYTVKQENNSTLIADCMNYKRNGCKKFFGIIPDDRLANIKENIERIPLQYSYDSDTSQYILEDWPCHNIAYDLSREPIGEFTGTPFSALQFILYAHPKKLYLVGWDCGAGYAYNKPNAMAPANYQVSILKKYFLPFIEIHYPDIEIISINPVGLKGVFHDVYTQSYLDEHPELINENVEILNEKGEVR